MPKNAAYREGYNARLLNIPADKVQAETFHWALSYGFSFPNHKASCAVRGWRQADADLAASDEYLEPLRKSLTTPPGYTIIGIDFGQIEARMFAYYAKTAPPKERT